MNHRGIVSLSPNNTLGYADFTFSGEPPPHRRPSDKEKRGSRAVGARPGKHMQRKTFSISSHFFLLRSTPHKMIRSIAMVHGKHGCYDGSLDSIDCLTLSSEKKREVIRLVQRMNFYLCAWRDMEIVGLSSPRRPWEDPVSYSVQVVHSRIDVEGKCE